MPGQDRLQLQIILPLAGLSCVSAVAQLFRALAVSYLMFAKEKLETLNATFP